MKTCKFVLGFLASVTLVSTLSAVNYTQKGPMSFKEYDTNNDGFVSESEFYDLRAKKMEAKANQGMRMKNAGNAPTFESFDTNGDKKLTKTELLEGQMKNMKQKMNQKGMGKGMNNSK